MDETAWLRCVAKFDAPEVGCWPWTGSILDCGYGQFWLDGKMRPAHRVVYEHLVGPIPDGLTIDHECHNNDETCVGGWDCLHRRCVRPDHLDPVTHRVNNLRSQGWAAIHAAKTHCDKGHPFTPDNMRGGNPRERVCRECANDRNRRYRERQKLLRAA